jgi:hypothetical protein
MFNKLFRRTKKNALVRKTEQQILDLERYNNAGNQLMQLHLDRMQTALNSVR